MEIDLYSKLQNPIEAIDRMGEWFAKGGMFKCSKVEQGKMLALICMAEKKSPTQIMREYHVMDDGTIAPRARNIHARFLAEGGDVEWLLTGEEQTEWDKIVAKAVFKWRDKSPLTFSFSTLDARKQGLNVDNPKGGWRKNPARMCRARLMSLGVDFFAPHITMGAPDDDDGDQMPGPSINMQATPAAPAPEPAKVVKAEVIDISPGYEKAITEYPPPSPVETAPTTPSPKPAPVETPAPAAAQDSPGISNELLAKVENAIGEHGLAALTWLRRNGHLRHDHGLDKLSEKMAVRIVKHTDKFLEAVQRTATPNTAAA